MFVFARRVPASPGAPREGTAAPYFTLADSGGRTVTLSRVLKANRGVLLVFYRGYW
jgi:peroxiredoxin